jgi:excisionase family DNA binding protein
MTGRDLILYILSHGLEDAKVYENGKFIGFMTAGEAAVKMNVGIMTIHVWVSQKKLDGFMVGDTLYIPADAKSPMESS